MTDTLIAGRELDALVAEKVMGAAVSWFSLQPVPHGEEWLPGDGGDMPNQEMLLPEARVWGNIPHYSTNIAAAWEVVEKLRASGRHPLIESRQGNELWAVDFAPNEFRERYSDYAVADSAPLAICLAALRAVEA